MTQRRQYSDDDKATVLAVLAANGGDLRRTARETGIPKSTLEGWVAAQKIHLSELTDTKKRSLADELERLALTIVDAMPDKVEAATLQQSATSLGIAIDKMQLLRGKPTDIIDDASLTDDQRISRVAALLDRARTRRDGHAAGDRPDVAADSEQPATDGV